MNQLLVLWGTRYGVPRSIGTFCPVDAQMRLDGSRAEPPAARNRAIVVRIEPGGRADPPPGSGVMEYTYMPCTTLGLARPDGQQPHARSGTAQSPRNAHIQGVLPSTATVHATHRIVSYRTRSAGYVRTHISHRPFRITSCMLALSGRLHQPSVLSNPHARSLATQRWLPRYTPHSRTRARLRPAARRLYNSPLGAWSVARRFDK